MNYGFTYGGTVESSKDPLKLGRLKVRVPHVYGSDATGSGYIPVNDLPWALPAGMPAGGSALSGGFSHLPEPGDKVWVRFLDGEPEKPIWEWGMQSITDSDELPLHRYALTPLPVGPPDRALWTRYSHAIEINEGSIILTTSQGYRLVATDASAPGASDGNIALATQKGNMIQLDDLDDTIKIISFGDLEIDVEGVLGMSDSFSWITMTKDFGVRSGRKFTVTSTSGIEMTTAEDILIDALGNTTFTTTGDFLMGFATLRLGLAATEAAVLGNLLVTYLTSLQTWLDTHTHESASPGSPTTPPLIPSVSVVPLPATVISATVRVQN